jgi:hypothetical protein
MTYSSSALAALILLVAAIEPSAAQTATQVVRFQVLVQQAAVVQRLPEPITLRGRDRAVATGSYAFAANVANRKITASLDEAMPDGSSLAVAMMAPEGAQSAGETTLGTNAADVVTAIPASRSNGLPVRYSVRAPTGLGAAEQRTVTYTVTAAP